VPHFGKSKGLEQGEIAGLSERQVRRLESGDVYPHSSTLNKLAAAHQLPAAEYVRQLAAWVADAA
jgi:transcriptional regulator with XRE-family HTH domain